ncbi:MAG: AAA family ATPase [Chloroflexi bacterium]|nr:AAA family ATPase [Chloroflexota bacterium]
MTTNSTNGHLAANRIEVEPTDRQRAAHELAEAFVAAGGVDWTTVESSLRLLTDSAGYISPAVESGRTAAARINEAILTGQEPLQADFDAVRFALEQMQRAEPLELVDGLPEQYWQGWLVENWLPRDCVSMLTGDGGVGKSRLALQLAWSLSGNGQWLGETGLMPPNGADYGMGFEPLGPGTIVYATWEDSPEQIRGRLYWLEQSGKTGDGQNFKIADMRSRGHLWASGQHNAVPGLTPAGKMLRHAAEQHKARLLVIDTLGVANGASEIDRAQVGAFFADWAAWADANDCAVLLIAHPPKTPGVAYSGSTGILGGVRAMWTIERVRRDCQGDCGSPKNCNCEPAYAYRLVNAKQNYSRNTGSVWLTNRNGVWFESNGRVPDYGDEVARPSRHNDDADDMFKDAL